MLRNLASLPYPNWKIVVDTANGTQTEIIRQLFLDLNLDYTCTDYCNIQSPHFIPRDTEVASHFTDLMRTVLNTGADFGIGFDADGDRVVFVDETGQYIPGDYSCSLVAKHSDTACLVTPISSSSVVDKLGLPVYRTPVGSTQVAQVMKDKGCTFGFEANGGSICSELHMGRDGAATMVKFLNCLKKINLPVSSAIATLPKFYLFRDKTDCPKLQYDTIYQQARAKYSQYSISDIDGIKIDLGHDEWLLFRGSGNAPEFRVMAQSPQKPRSEQLGAEGLALVKSIVSRTYNLQPTTYHQVDTLHVFDSILAFPDQCRQVISDIALQHVPHECYLVQNVVVSGMGGSALGGRIIAGIERQTLRLPIVISTDYHLPNFVDSKSLVILSSYSGNTEETISALHEARARNAQIYILASGGKLADMATQYNLPSYIYDPHHNPSSQPRMGLGYNILALITLLSRCQLIHPAENLNLLPDHLKSRQSEFPFIKKLGPKLAGRIPVLIASEHLKGAAHALKNLLNENAKTFACLFDLPEANHHLLEGLSYPNPNSQNLIFLFIESDLYHPELKKIYPLTESVVQKNHIPTISLKISGPSRLFEAMEAVQSGAYLAYELSQLNGVDPGPIPWVHWYKDQLP
jgi:bifunctional phosphoglucose/phosphomannose isomerase